MSVRGWQFFYCDNLLLGIIVLIIFCHFTKLLVEKFVFWGTEQVRFFVYFSWLWTCCNHTHKQTCKKNIFYHFPRNNTLPWLFVLLKISTYPSVFAFFPPWTQINQKILVFQMSWFLPFIFIEQKTTTSDKRQFVHLIDVGGVCERIGKLVSLFSSSFVS